MPRTVCAPEVQLLQELAQKDQPQYIRNESKVRKSQNLKMNGKTLVIGIGSFFLLFFAVESWLMRAWPTTKLNTFKAEV